MIGHLLDRLTIFQPERTVVVVSPGMPAVAEFVAPAETVIQDRESRHGRMIRFSNWRGHHDRETGNPVIYMTEARVDSIIPDPEEQPIVPDSYRYEMVLPE